MTVTDGTTTKAGLLGWPVEHSISPAMFNAAFAALGLPWRYEAFPVQPENLAEALHDLSCRALFGVNVTVPHKRAVMRHLNIIEPAARAVGAVNTILISSDNPPLLRGTNTDVTGFEQDLRRALRPGEAQNSRALVLGAGGAARARVRRAALRGWPSAAGRAIRRRSKSANEYRSCGYASSNAARAAANITSNGAAWPVHNRKAAAPCRTNMPNPPTGRAPASSACWSSIVLAGR